MRKSTCVYRMLLSVGTIFIDSIRPLFQGRSQPSPPGWESIDKYFPRAFINRMQWHRFVMTRGGAELGSRNGVYVTNLKLI